MTDQETEGPRRVRMSRQHPWRAENPTAVRVDRATKWGNPFTAGVANPLGYAGDYVRDREHAVELYRVWWATRPSLLTVARAQHTYQHAHIRDLSGRDLACWCPLPEPGAPDVCHAAFLMEVANAPDVVDSDPMGDPDTRRASAAMDAWGCPRPDKRHYLTQSGAWSQVVRQRQLEEADHARGHPRSPRGSCDLCTPGRPPREAYRCRCGGWAVGHPSDPHRERAGTS